MKKTIRIVNKEIKFKSALVACCVLIVGILLAISLNSYSSYSNHYNKPVSVDQLITSPDGYRGGTIKFIGKVFKVEGSDGSYALQVYSDIKNSTGNIIVYSWEKFKDDDYIEVEGDIGEAFNGNNAFGASLTAPTVIAKSIKLIDADEAIAPTITTIDPAISRTIGGLIVTLQKVQYAKDETRIFIHFNNTGSTNFTFYTSSGATLIQNKKKIQTISDYSRNTYDIDSDILANTERDVKLYYESIESGAKANLTIEVLNNTDYSNTTLTFEL